jgi:hypothetical protein
VGGTTVTEQRATALRETTELLRAEASVAFGHLHVVLMRELAARLRTGGTPADNTPPMEALAYQLDAAIRELRHTLPRWQPPTG